MNRKLRGQRAEQLACDFLQRQGMKLIESNYRCRLGEIDLVMQDGQQLVFVEVRFRRNQTFGGPLASISHRKKARLIATAKHYLLSKKVRNSVRLDVVGISLDRQIQWIPNALEDYT